MALGNTFGATSFASYGAYWITFGLFSDLDRTSKAADAGASACQTETLMGLFMIVSLPSQPTLQILIHISGSTGLVHLHYTHAALHAKVKSGHVPSFLLPGPELPALGYHAFPLRLVEQYNGLDSEGWRGLWFTSCYDGLV